MPTKNCKNIYFVTGFRKFNQHDSERNNLEYLSVENNLVILDISKIINKNKKHSYKVDVEDRSIQNQNRKRTPPTSSRQVCSRTTSNGLW